MEIMEEVTRQRVDCLRLPVFAKLLRHFSVKVANTLSLEIEWSEIGQCESHIADSRLDWLWTPRSFYEPCLNVHHEVTIPCDGALGA